MADRNSTEYINSVNYSELEDKLKGLKEVIDDLTNKNESSRKLRYAEIDIEAEREAGRLQPDELYIPLHIIDTNIRREQSPYVQYVVQSPRAVICKDPSKPSDDLQVLEADLTEKLRYEGWQTAMFANIDGFQANGYSIMEVVQDQNAPGEVSYEAVQYNDFAFTTDTRDMQAVEMVMRSYYFTKTRLLELCGDVNNPQSSDFIREQVQKLIDQEPNSSDSVENADIKDRSLYKIFKVMFRIKGIVNVAWCCPEKCDGWLRVPRPLYIGRRKLVQPTTLQKLGGMASQLMTGQPQLPQHQEEYEKNFPYIVFPYLISENDTIQQLKGRIFLDQDLQEATSSMLSSAVTQARRAAGMYFSKDVTDPNDDLLMQKNVFFQSGCIINSKVQAFNLNAPDPGIFSAINMLMAVNQNETSQVNFAVNNRKDSRKTAKEISTAEQQQGQLSTVQVVLFSIALTQMYRLMVDVIKSRVAAGLIQVDEVVAPLYARKFTIKPSGDVDVILRQQRIQQMTQAWPVIQNTPLAQAFLSDLIGLMFPEQAAKYQMILQQAAMQQQSAQAQQQQQFMGMVQQLGNGIIQLSKHKDYFSDVGKLHALPVVEQAAQQIEQVMKQQQPQRQ